MCATEAASSNRAEYIDLPGGGRIKRADLRARHVAVRSELGAIVARADQRRAETAERSRETVRLLDAANREGARAVEAMRRAIELYAETIRRRHSRVFSAETSERE